MSDKTSRTIFENRIPDHDHDGAEAFMVGAVYYSKGGPNYFGGGVDPRGYYVSVTKVSRKPGSYSVSFVLGGGGVSLRAFFTGAKAFSAKKLDALVTDPAMLAKLDTVKDESYRRLAAVPAGTRC